MPKRQQRTIFSTFRFAPKNQRGMTLVEVLLALSILAVVAVVFLMAMSTSSRGVLLSQEHVSAESLAKSQMEYIKQQNYSDVGNYALLSQVPAEYTIQIAVEALDPRQIQTGADEGLQKIIITITRDGDTVFTLEGYKCYTGY